MWTISELSLFITICFGFPSSNVHGLKIPFEVYPRALRPGNNFRSTSKLTFAFGEYYAEAIDNKKDVRYATNITINGKQVPVALDTGSTDLWVNPPGGIGQFNDTTIPLQLRYGDGSYGVSGTIGVSPFKFSSYEVLRQAFLHVNASTIKGLDINGIYGILGLSFDFGTASRVNGAIKRRYGNSSTWGQSVLHNIFDQHPDQPNFIALSLSRTEDLEDTQGGSFSIGEYHSNYTTISTERQLPQFPEGGTRWTTLLESIVVGGQAVPLKSKIHNVPAGHGVALLDTGDPTAMFPTAVWDGIYSIIPGSVRYSDADGTVWVIPCNTTTIVEFGFGGKKYPIHPLDLSLISDPLIVDNQTVVACVSAFRGTDGFAVQGFEYSLGDGFLRNVYSVFHFGNSTSKEKPYMQLLSRFDPRKAVSQVATIRMAPLPPELPPATLVRLLRGSSPSATSVDPTSPTLSVDKGGVKPAVHLTMDDGASFSIDVESLKKIGLLGLVLLATNLIVGLVLLVFAVLNCVRRGSDKKGGPFVGGTAATQYVPVKVEDDAFPGYQKRYGE